MKQIFTDRTLDEAEIDNQAKALVWVIDQECLYDKVIPGYLCELFESNDEVLDISEEYPEHIGIAIRFIKNQEILGDFLTSEYFGSILLSEPDVVDLSKYPYGKHVYSPYAKFDGEKFIILGMDEQYLTPWREK